VIAATMRQVAAVLTKGNDGTCRRSVSSSGSFRWKTTEEKTAGAAGTLISVTNLNRDRNGCASGFRRARHRTENVTSNGL
jgi:hypothetical protein